MFPMQPPRRPHDRPQMTREEAQDFVLSSFRVVDGGLVVSVTGGVYGGYGIVDETLYAMLQPEGGLEYHCRNLCAQHVDTFRIDFRCLTDSPIGGNLVRNPAGRHRGATFDLICRWLSRIGLGLPTRLMDFSETWMSDDDVENLILTLGLGRRPELPEQIVLARNCLTMYKTVELVDVLMFALTCQTPSNQTKKCVLDVRYNWIEDVANFRQELIAKFHRPDARISCMVEHTFDAAKAVLPSERWCQDVNSAATPAVELVVLAGHSWNMVEGSRVINHWPKDQAKRCWDSHMCGPSSKLAGVLEYEGLFTRWDCPLCQKNNAINEHGGQQRCPSVTFGGILMSHLRGDAHRQNVYRFFESNPEALIEEFDLGCRAYFFNWLSGSQGYTVDDAEKDEVVELARRAHMRFQAAVPSTTMRIPAAVPSTTMSTPAAVPPTPMSTPAAVPFTTVPASFSFQHEPDQPPPPPPLQELSSSRPAPPPGPPSTSPPLHALSSIRPAPPPPPGPPPPHCR